MCAAFNIAVLCISLISRLLGMFLRYCSYYCCYCYYYFFIFIVIKLLLIRLFGMLKVTINFLEIRTNIGETLHSLCR